MIEVNNKHIVLILLIIIICVFIYNYDVYVIPKNEPLCKPIYVTKREITPEIRAELNKTESEVLNETFNNLAEIEYFESFGNINNDDNNISSEYNIPPKSFSSFVIPSLTTQHKIKVIDSVIKILSYIPTNYSENQIKQMIEYFAIIYEASPNIEIFYKNIASSTKIRESPYNSKYSHLILFLIGKFDIDYLSYSNSIESNELCAMNELLNEIIDKKSKDENNNLKNDNLNEMQTNNETYNENVMDSNNINKSSDYLSDEFNKKTKNEYNFNPKKVLNMIKKSKPEINDINYDEQKVILPETNKITMHTKSNSNDLINPIMNSNSINNSNKKVIKKTPQKKCNGVKCSYKCDSSYSDAISYLDGELKPLEGFGNIYDNYASFN